MATEQTLEESPNVPRTARTTYAMRKAIVDKNRKRRGNTHRKRLQVLNSPDHPAFKGWSEEIEPWSMQICEDYIEWCHIGKLFPAWRHHHNRHTNKANLKYCENPAFVQRCIEIWQVLYKTPFVERNEVTLSIARGAYAEVVLKKEVDWSTIKESTYVSRPENGSIPRGVLKFPEGGLGPIRKDAQDKSTIEISTSESEEDSNSDGARAPRATRAVPPIAPLPVTEDPIVRGASSSRGRRPRRPSKVPRLANQVGLGSTSTTVLNPSLPPQNATDVFDFEPNDETPMETSVPVLPGQGDSTTVLNEALDLLKTKDTTIASLQSDVKKLQSDLKQRDALISEQDKELQRLRQKQHETITLSDMDEGFIEYDPHHLERIVEDLTSGLIELTPPTKRVKRSPIVPSKVLPTVAEDAIVETDGIQETQDSLSFPALPSHCTIFEDLRPSRREQHAPCTIERVRNNALSLEGCVHSLRG